MQRVWKSGTERGFGPPIQFLALLFIGFALRFTSFGDPLLHIADEFYRFVGMEMHAGALPYVDIWDRKPFGLFALYYLFAAISPDVVVYQAAAWVSASATAFMINLIAQRRTSRRGGMFAGFCYLALLCAFWGRGGEAAVFYNLLLASAARLLLVNPSERRILIAMALCGVAITLKQTALFESLFFGLAVILARPRIRVIVLSIALGMLPTLAITLFYFLAGHWHEFWQAMVLSSLSRTTPDTTTMLVRGGDALLLLAPLLAVAAWGSTGLGSDRRFVGGWFAAALLGYFSVPTFFPHYALPLLPPLCIAAAPLFGRGGIGAIATASVGGLSLLLHNPFASHQRSIDSAAKLAEIVTRDTQGRLLVFDGPVYLYTLPGRHHLSPLVFPQHLNQLDERDVSHLDTEQELRRILAQRPTTVVKTTRPRNDPPNMASWDAVSSYVTQNCRRAEGVTTYEMGYPQEFEIWFCR